MFRGGYPNIRWSTIFVLYQNCLSECLVYNAVVNTSATKNYYRTCEKSFKWEFKENYENCTIDWLIAVKVHPYIRGTRKCDLCLCEKLLIARADSASLLNKHDKLFSKCHHMNKFKNR